MKKILLYGHGGAYNHGAEAILRSSVSIFRRMGCPVLLSTHFPDQDKEFGLDKLVDRLIPADFAQVPREASAETFEERERVAEDIYRGALAEIDKDTVCIAVGGDNYCYPNWHRQSVFHRTVKRRGGTSILWGCSIQPEMMDDRMTEVLKGHDHIYARESLTANALRAHGITRITQVPDPAFHLPPEPTILPDGFCGCAVALNLSPMLLRRSDRLLEHFTAAAHLLLARVDTLLLVPHVTMPADNDRYALELLAQQLEPQERVRLCWVPENANAAQRKYLISQCEMLICCRTHASIAGYSTGIPTLVVGYSIKSKGIGKDIGMERWVIPVEDSDVFAAEDRRTMGRAERNWRTAEEEMFCTLRSKGEINVKKVILYGVGSVELRRDAEYFMDDKYEIVGYSDSHYSYDSLDGAAFYPPEALCHQPVDYVVLLAFQESVLTQMREYLLSLNVRPEKIIAPTIFLHRNAEKYQLDLIHDVCLNCHGIQGLIFGLSYSQRDICIRSLEIPFYDCSWSSLDLYYNYRIFQYMEEHKMLTGVRLALLVFPYNYFDYDMSLSLRQYENGRIFSTWRLDDWHHYEQVPGGKDYVANYRMFGKKISAFYHLSRYEMQNRDICQMKVGSARLENLWFHSHTETVHENIELFSVFLSGLIKNGIAPALIVPPFFLNALDPESKEAYSKKKYEFYQIIQHILPEISDQIRVFDYAGVFADKRELFMDLIHLNTAGAEAFTQSVNRDVLRAMV